MSVEIFAALIEVVPQPGTEHIFDGYPGAYTNFYALANSESDFRAIADQAIQSLGLSIREVDQVLVVEPDEQSPRIQALLGELSESSPWIRDTFHTYESSE
jgi:hypothetical protein